MKKEDNGLRIAFDIIGNIFWIIGGILCLAEIMMIFAGRKVGGLLCVTFISNGLLGLFCKGFSQLLKNSEAKSEIKESEQENHAIPDDALLEKCFRYNIDDTVSDIRKPGIKYVVIGEEFAVSEDAEGKPFTERVYNIKDPYGSVVKNVSGNNLRKIKEL